MIDGFTIDLLASKFGFNIEKYAKYIRLCEPGFTKSLTSLDNIVSLENRIAYDFGRDRMTAQLCSCLM